MRPRNVYLEIRDLTKTFGVFSALRNVSLQVFEGEFVCFLGPSGCGKTTLLRTIAGLEFPTQGVIHQAGRDVTHLSPLERDFGIVFQSYALFPNLTVFKNVAYGLRSKRLPKQKIEERVGELLHLVGLDGYGEKYPAQLSGGQQQRVALIRALAASPGLLLLDEPLSALDARVRLTLRRELRSLHRALKITTIMVTHDQEEALTMADRIVVMNQGIIEQIGTPEDIYHNPSTLFVTNFVGAMNSLRAVRTSACCFQMGNVEFVSAIDPAPECSGQSVALCIRPEDVSAPRTDTNTPNRFDGTIADFEFIGPFCRVTILPDDWGRQTLTVDLSSNAQRDLELAVGKRMRVSCPPELIRVFPPQN